MLMLRSRKFLPTIKKLVLNWYAVAVSVAAANVTTNIANDHEAQPQPVKTNHPTWSNDHIHECCPRQEDETQDGPDGAVESTQGTYPTSRAN